MKITNIIKSIFSGTKDYYISNIESDCKKRIKQPVRMMVLDFSKTLVMLALIIIIFVTMTPAFRSMVDYSIENYTTYNCKINDLKKQVENSRNDMIGAALRTVRQFKNPTFNGLRFTTVDGVHSVYPISRSRNEKKVYYLLSKWAKTEGYDGLIFGESYSGLNGTFYWSNGQNDKYDTDMELIINMMKEKGCKKIMSFVSNVECKNYIPYVSNYIDGLLIISEVQNYHLEISALKFWKSNRSIIVRAKNFSAEIINEELAIASRPKGNKNRMVVYNPHKKDFIQNFKDKGLETAGKIKAVINMADVINDEYK